MKKYKVIIFGALVCLIGLFYLYLSSTRNINQKYIKHGGFSRNIEFPTLTLKESFNLKGEFYFIGMFKSKIYLISDSNRDLISLSDSTPNIENKSLPLMNLDIKSVQLDTKRGEIILFCGNQSKIIIIDAETFKILKTILTPNIFLRGARINKNYVLIEQKPKTLKNQFVFYELNKNSLNYLKEIDILKGNAMEEDGNLVSDNERNFVFCSYYKNAFFVLDSLGNNITQRKTIDTVSHAPKAILVEGTKMVYTEPLRITNENCYFSEGTFYIESMIESDMSENLKNNSIIDVYDIKSKYKLSYIVGSIENERPKSVLIQNRKVFVLTTNKLLIYDKK